MVETVSNHSFFLCSVFAGYYNCGAVHLIIFKETGICGSFCHRRFVLQSLGQIESPHDEKDDCRRRDGRKKLPSPHTGAYAELQSCSIPNPILLSGTVFITRETGYLQQSFTGPKSTAFVSNSTAYITLNTGYTYSFQKDGSDYEAVQMALKFMKIGKPAFMHIHLQDPGGAGTESMIVENDTNKNAEWKGNIWAANSPYRTITERADSLLGVFLIGLEKQGILDRTMILVIGDHGQNDGGWHPLEFLDSSITTVVLWGAGIKKGARLPYAEHIDIVPTISALIGVEPPKTSRGRVIAEALQEFSRDVPPRKTLIKDMDELFIQYRKTINEAAYLIENNTGNQGALFSRLNEIKTNFYDITRFVEWPRFSSIEDLLENDYKSMKQLDDFLIQIKKDK
jgi:hypothetical protein